MRVFYNEKAVAMRGEMHLPGTDRHLIVHGGQVAVPEDLLDLARPILARDGWIEKSASSVIASDQIRTPRALVFERPGANRLDRQSGMQVHVAGQALTVEDDCVTVPSENRELIRELEKAGFKFVRPAEEGDDPEAMPDANLVPLDEFVELGLLQEVNRQFFHPLGMALALDKKGDGSFFLSCVYDGREDPEGIFFDFANLPMDEQLKMIANADFVRTTMEDRRQAREALFGDLIEPLSLELRKDVKEEPVAGAIDFPSLQGKPTAPERIEAQPEPLHQSISGSAGPVEPTEPTEPTEKDAGDDPEVTPEQ